MLKSALLPLVLKAMSLIVDSHGNHFRPNTVAADAIADASIADPLWPGDEGEKQTAMLLTDFGARESGWQLSPRGSNDHSHACGPFQHWASGEQCLRLRRDYPYAAAVAIRDFRASALVDAFHPWAAYCGGGAAGVRISDVRSAEVRALLLAVGDQ